MPLEELAGQGWLQIAELSLAFLLSALIGVEREIRHKSAGLRTYPNRPQWLIRGGFPKLCKRLPIDAVDIALCRR